MYDSDWPRSPASTGSCSASWASWSSSTAGGSLRPFFIGGDLLYHWGLTHTILLGTFPPEGPYIGLPAYYPPGFHLILAGLASIPGLDVPSATALLGILWLPVIPLGCLPAHPAADRPCRRRAGRCGPDGVRRRPRPRQRPAVGQLDVPRRPGRLPDLPARPGLRDPAVRDPGLRACDRRRATLGGLGADRRRAARRVRAHPGAAPAPDPDRPRDARAWPAPGATASRWKAAIGALVDHRSRGATCSSARGSSGWPGSSRRTAASRSIRRPTCCRSGSASGTTRSSSG